MAMWLNRKYFHSDLDYQKKKLLVVAVLKRKKKCKKTYISRYYRYWFLYIRFFLLNPLSDKSRLRQVKNNLKQLNFQAFELNWIRVE